MFVQNQNVSGLMFCVAAKYSLHLGHFFQQKDVEFLEVFFFGVISPDLVYLGTEGAELLGASVSTIKEVRVEGYKMEM